MITETQNDIAKPQGLSEPGVTAWDAITSLLEAEDATYTGGCKAFYSPQEWEARGEEYGTKSVLVVVHDGGEVGRYFNYDKEDYKAIERMNAKLKSVGLWFESCTCWYSAIYPIAR